MSARYDLVIVGGGPVGASLARALAGVDLSIALVEAVPPRDPGQPSYDERVLALAHGSRRIFEGMGLWPRLAPHAHPIAHIHVSQRGRFGATRLHAREEGVDALGHVIPTRAIGQTLWDELPRQANLDIHCPARLTALELTRTSARLRLDTDTGPRTLEAALVVAADGGASPTRRLAGIDTEETDYGQSAVIATVTPERPHRDTAYERFTESGPLALLPMSEGRCSLVFTVRRGEEDALLALDDTAFLARVEARLPHQGGYLRVSPRRAYPLRLVRARRLTAPRLALAGNAAHTLHPVAGQGFNLGLRDVAHLAEAIADAHRAGTDLGDPELLAAYERACRPDHDRTIGFTDFLARAFVLRAPPAGHLRGLGLVALNLCAPLKRGFARHTLGLTPPLPRLARGLAP